MSDLDLATEHPELFALFEAREKKRPPVFTSTGFIDAEENEEVVEPDPDPEEVELEEEFTPEELDLASTQLTPAPAPGEEITLPPAVDPELAQLRELQTRLASDPGLRDVISNYVSGRTQQTQPPQVTQNPALSNFPTTTLSQDDLDLADPVSRYALTQLEQMRAEMEETRRQANFAATQLSQVRQREALDAVNAAKSAFMAQTGLPVDYLPAIEQAAVNSGAMITYMKNGVDPVTGLPVTPDSYKATLSALTIGSRMVPEVVEYEKTKAIAEDRARRVKDQARKNKLAGVSGTTGAPRSTPSTPPSTPYERKQAAIRELATAMSGEN